MSKSKVSAIAVKAPKQAPAHAARLSDPALAAGVAALKKRLGDDPEYSRQMLQHAGILNSAGRVAKAFGG